jgi:hypothetical protein
MTNTWKHQLDFSDFYHSDIYSLADKAKKIRNRVQLSHWYEEANYNDELGMFLEELVDAGEENNVEHFDAVMNFLYDIFDGHGAWVKTR